MTADDPKFNEAASALRVIYVLGSSRKVCQLTGEFDRERQQFTPNRTESRFGVVATDLGSSFEHNGRLYFLFGDTFPSKPDNNYRPDGGDAIAFSTDTNPEDCVHLQFVTAPDGDYISPRVQNTSLGGFEVPTGGFSANGMMYVFFTTDHYQENGRDYMGRSVLAKTSDPAQVFKLIYNVSKRSDEASGGFKFINNVPWIVDNASIPGLPQNTGTGVLIWGSGKYRASNPFLAFVPLNALETRSAWRYFIEIDTSSGLPRWGTKESDAKPLFLHPYLGELSVIWNQYLQKWLMLYNGPRPRGINFRVADKPWGPWSPADVLFDPWTDGGYCHFIHVSYEERHCDAVHDPGRENTYGGEYGPYMMARYTKGDAQSTTIYYALSTWNPYNTVLMKSTLRFAQPAEVYGNPTLIQGKFGAKGNFEGVVPLAGNGLAHYWRNNDDPALPWYGPSSFGLSAGRCDAVTLIQSNIGSPGNLEVIARTQNTLASFWRDSVSPFPWHGPYQMSADGQLITGVYGNPVLIQSRYGNKGNFEMVVPLFDGGLAHYWRDNDAAGFPWHGPVVFGNTGSRYETLTLIQSNFGSPGDLAVIARLRDRLEFFWRDSSSPFTWHGPFDLSAGGTIITGACGTPTVIQSRFGSKGNFEMVVPQVNGGLAHYWRNNDDPNLPWYGPTIFGASIGRIDDATLIQSNFGNPGDLVAVIRVGKRLAFFWRDSGPGFIWNGPFYFIG